MPTATPKTLVFIHGLHENARSWSAWEAYFEQRGYVCHAPNYPYHDSLPADLRANPDRRLSTIRLNDVVAHYAAFLDALADKQPVLVGHSMGGLVVQKLIQARKGAAGVCLASASPKGVVSFAWSYLKANLVTVNPLRGDSLYLGSKAWFHYAIANTLSRAQSDAMYEEAVVPESRNIPRSSQDADGRIDFRQSHNPLLFVSAEHDHIIPLSLNVKNFKAYRDPNSRRDFKEFKGHSHSLCVQPGWEEIAEFVRGWVAGIENQ